MRKIRIIGGGIAGLALAQHLEAAGLDWKVIERQPQWRIAGTGLYTPANGIAALDRLGLGTAIRTQAAAIRYRDIRDNKGRTVLKLDLRKIWGQERDCRGIRRIDLHELLLKGLPNERIELGQEVTALKQQNDSVHISYANGAQEEVDVVVGADGLRSQTRALLFGEKALREVSPRACRFMAARPSSIVDWTLFASGVGQFLLIPCTDKEMYCYVNRKTSTAISKTDFMEPFKKFAAPLPEILDNWSPEGAYWDALEELEPLEQFGQGRIVLMGDAAHGMPPYMAQGSSLALEDAEVLAALLKQNTDATLAEAFTAAQKERVEWVRARNRKREKLSKLPFWIARLGLKVVGRKNWTADYQPLVPAPAI